MIRGYTRSRNVSPVSPRRNRRPHRPALQDKIEAFEPQQRMTVRDRAAMFEKQPTRTMPPHGPGHSRGREATTLRPDRSLRPMTTYRADRPPSPKRSLYQHERSRHPDIHSPSHRKDSYTKHLEKELAESRRQIQRLKSDRY